MLETAGMITVRHTTHVDYLRNSNDKKMAIRGCENTEYGSRSMQLMLEAKPKEIYGRGDSANSQPRMWEGQRESNVEDCWRS